jgi:hypothetical protein
MYLEKLISVEAHYRDTHRNFFEVNVFFLFFRVSDFVITPKYRVPLINIIMIRSKLMLVARCINSLTYIQRVFSLSNGVK